MTPFLTIFRGCKSTLLLWALGLIAGLPVVAQNAPGAAPMDTGYATIVNTFFDLTKQMKYKEAADCLLNTNPADIDNTSMHEALFTSLDGVHQKCGDFKKFSTVLDKRMGSDIAYVNGIGLYEKGAVKFEFVFAQEDAKWELLTCSYSYDVLGDLRALAGLPTSAAPSAPTATGKDGAQ